MVIHAGEAAERRGAKKKTGTSSSGENHEGVEAL